MAAKKTTPERFVKEWLPDYGNRFERWTNGDNGIGCKSPDWFYEFYFSEALKAFKENERMNHEWMIQELKDRLEIIKRVTPYSFKSLTDEDKAVGYYLASCECGWWGSSALLDGGGAIADTGDYFDYTCPFCGSIDIGDKSDPYHEVWDQACREQREECAMSVAGESDHTGMRFVIETDDDLRLHIINALSAPAPEFKLTEKE